MDQQVQTSASGRRETIDEGVKQTPHLGEPQLHGTLVMVGPGATGTHPLLDPRQL